ncbi:WD40 repeat domain-containing protein [Streptomyces varsoviensis]|uniref:WD40 repeat domain-containing protein n=1 Tax=Streptomyces varsoviensis TaxID=67373 RepID=UPI0033E71C91
MSPAAGPPDEEDPPEGQDRGRNEGRDQGPYLRARASERSRIYQAVGDQYITVTERDLHLHFVDGVRGARRAVPATGGDVCPYPGLVAFGAEQADWFFGRDQLVADLLDRLDRQSREGGSRILVAPSGTGKSSLLRAGLLPAIADGRLPGSARWPCAVFSPTAAPLSALTEQLAHITGSSPRQVALALALGPAQTTAMLRAALRRRSQGQGRDQGQQGRGQGQVPAPRCVIVVDQLEELFTLRVDRPALRRFLDVLTAIAEAAPGEGPAGLVVFGLRSDFYTQCAAHPELQAALQDRQLFIGPMAETGVREAILHPARAAGLEAEPGLVEVLLRDLSAVTGPDAAGADGGRYAAERLPLLAHALRATWQQRHGNVLTVDGYQSTGGIAHALANTADQLYDRLDPPGRQVARRLLLSLVKVGEGTEDVRRPMPYETLLAHSRAPDRAAEIIASFTDARLLTRGADQVALTHEALLRAWPRLREWIDADRPGNIVRQELEDAAAGWRRADRDAGLLYRGSRLEAAGRWADAAPADHPSTTATLFLAASARQQRRAARVRRVVIAVLSALALLASGAAAYAFVERSAAQDQRSAAEGQRNIAILNQLRAEADSVRETDPSLAAQLDLTAYRRKPTPDAYTRLLADANTPLSIALPDRAGPVQAVAFSRDGHTLAGGRSNGTVRLWDTTDPTHPTDLGTPLSGHTDEVRTIAFSPDGRTMATGSVDRTVQLWDMSHRARPARLATLTPHSSHVRSVVFSPDGSALATGGLDGTVRLWDLSDRAHPAEFGKPITDRGERFVAVAFSPDGRTLATGSIEGTARLWNVRDPARPTPLGKPFSSHFPEVRTVAFSPDGRTMATGGDKEIYLWDAADPARPTQLGEPLTGHTNAVNAVAFGPDGHTLASGSFDQSARLWDTADPAHPTRLGEPLTGHTNAINAIAFRSDGHTLATAGSDGAVRLWNQPDTVLTSHAGAVNTVAFSPVGHTLASAGMGGPIRLWNMSDPERPVEATVLSGPTAGIVAVAFSEDGRTLAGVGDDGTTWLWDLTRRRDRPVRVGRSRIGDTENPGVTSVAFSPRGHTLATAREDGTVQLWNVSDPPHPTDPSTLPSEPEVGVTFVAFSPDGRRLAGAAQNKKAWLWDVTRPAPVGRALAGHQDINVNTVAFGPDGRTLATGSNDRSIRLWNVSDPDRPTSLGEPLTGHADDVNSLAFDRGGRLASGSGDRTIRLWDTDRADQTGAPLTGHTDVVESIAFSPDGRTLASASADHTVRLWSMDADSAARRICAYAGPPTRQQWKQYLPQLPYEPPCRR